MVAGERVESLECIVVLLISFSVVRVDVHLAYDFIWVVKIIVNLGKSLHLCVEHFCLKLEFKEHLCLLLKELVRQAGSVGRQELVVVLLGEVDKHRELLLVLGNQEGDVDCLIVAVVFLVELHQSLHTVLFHRQLDQKWLELGLHPVPDLLKKMRNQAFVNVWLHFNDLGHEANRAKQVETGVFSVLEVGQEGVEHGVVEMCLGGLCSLQGCLEEVGKEDVEVLVIVIARNHQSEIVILSQSLKCTLHEPLYGPFVQKGLLHARLHDVHLVEIKHREQVVEVVHLLVKDRVLRKAQFVHFLVELLLGLALSELFGDGANEVFEKVLVVHLVIGKEVDHVQFLRQAVRMEEVGVEGDQLVNFLHPGRKQESVLAKNVRG